MIYIMKIREGWGGGDGRIKVQCVVSDCEGAALQVAEDLRMQLLI